MYRSQPKDHSRRESPTAPSKNPPTPDAEPSQRDEPPPRPEVSTNQALAASAVEAAVKFMQPTAEQLAFVGSVVTAAAKLEASRPPEEMALLNTGTGRDREDQRR